MSEQPAAASAAGNGPQPNQSSAATAPPPPPSAGATVSGTSKNKKKKKNKKKGSVSVAPGAALAPVASASTAESNSDSGLTPVDSEASTPANEPNDILDEVTATPKAPQGPAQPTASSLPVHSDKTTMGDHTAGPVGASTPLSSSTEAPAPPSATLPEAESALPSSVSAPAQTSPDIPTSPERPTKSSHRPMPSDEPAATSPPAGPHDPATAPEAAPRAAHLFGDDAGPSLDIGTEQSPPTESHAPVSKPYASDTSAPMDESSSPLPIEPDEAESIAFDMPTVADVEEGNSDLNMVKGDGGQIPPLPTQLGAASSLFADDAETGSFLPDGPPLETFAPDYPPEAPSWAEDGPAPSSKQPETTAQPTAPPPQAADLFAQDGDAGSFLQDPSLNASGPDSAASPLISTAAKIQSKSDFDGKPPSTDTSVAPAVPKSEPPTELKSASTTAPAASTEPVPETKPASAKAAAKADPPPAKALGATQEKTATSAQMDTVEPLLEPDEAQSIAFDVPTFGDAEEGDVDLREAKKEGVPMPPAPKAMGMASALFADDAETDAFLPNEPLETFAPDYPTEPRHDDDDIMGYKTDATQPKTDERRSTEQMSKSDEGKSAEPAHKSDETKSSEPVHKAKALFGDDDEGEPFEIQPQDEEPKEQPGEVQNESHASSSKSPAPANTSAAALFADDDEGGLDIGGDSPVTEDPASKSHHASGETSKDAPANRSVQSMFSGDHTGDWFVDTSVDDSLNLGRADQDDEYPTTREGPQEEEMEYDESELPHGWYDESGQFNWYTDDEREQVRQSLIADGTLKLRPKAKATTTEAQQQQTHQGQQEPAANPYTPAAPQQNPYTPSALPSQYSATSPQGSYFRQQQTMPPPTSAYAPGYAQASPYAPAGGAAAGTFTPATMAYTPSGAPVAPAAPAAPAAPSPYNPYAPSAQTAPSPYAPAGSQPASAAAAPPAQAKPEPPKRVKSNAYDPPFLRTQKSFVRAASATPEPVHAPFGAPPAALPSAPPPGPPRAKTQERVPQYDTHAAAAPPRRHSEQPPFASETQSPTNAYEPLAGTQSQPPAPSRSPYEPPAASSPYAPPPNAQANRSMSPVHPPPRPATSSSEHPPKPTSFDPPLRASSSRPPSRHASRSNLQAAPVTSPFPNSQPAAPPVPAIPSQYAAPPKGPPKAATPSHSAYDPPPGIAPPPRGPSRGANSRSGSRASSPKFEKFQGAPPVPPIPHDVQQRVPPHVTPPQHSTPQFGAPPRITSPLRHEVRPEVSSSRPVSEVFNPQGGGAVWDEGESAMSHAPPVHSTPPGMRHADDSIETLASPDKEYDTVPLAPEHEDDGEAEEEHDPSKTPVARKVENPYGPSTVHPPMPGHGGAEITPRASQRNPYAAQSPEKPTSSDSYAPGSPRKPSHVSSAGSNDYGSMSKSSPKKAGSARGSIDNGPYAAPPSKDAPSAYAPRTSNEFAAPYRAQSRDSETYAPQRTQSRGSVTKPAGLHSRGSSAQDPYNPYAPSQTKATQDPYNPYAPSSQPKAAQDPYNPYAPSSQSQPKRDAISPYSTTSPTSVQDEYNPYGSSAGKADAYNPYAPSSNDQKPYEPSRHQSTSSFGAASGARSGAYEPYGAAPSRDRDLYSPMDMYGGGQSPPQSNYFQSMGPVDPTYVPQQVLDQRPVSEDPLGRCAPSARNIPLAVFGFGGVLVTSFPGAADDSADAPSYGYASHRGVISIRPVSEVVETSALSSNSVAFRGPLVFDPDTPKGAAGEKKRREAVLSYLSERAEEIERGLPYLKSHHSRARREEEAKLVLVRLLAALVEGEGRLFGTPAAEEAVRLALQPPASSQSVPLTNGQGNKGPAPKAATPAQLQQLSSLLLSGDKKDAALYAAGAGLWSHALVISSAVGPELWRDVVSRFTAAELSSTPQSAGLRAAYEVFGGVTQNIVDDLYAASNITDDPAADQWREVLAGVLFNSKPADLLFIDDLGNRFWRAGLRNAAQVCFLLSPNSPFSDMSPSASERPIKLVDNARDEDGTIFAEIAEYARSLVPTPKGSEVPHASLPQLVPYKIARAWQMAEIGDVEQAKRYCSAIEASVRPTKTARAHLPRHIAASMEDLLERLTGQPSVNPSAGIGMRKSKSGASLGSWIEGRLTKFIAGEDEDGPRKPNPEPKASGVQVGPFSHFSTISPGPSAGVSRAGSTTGYPSDGGVNTFNPAETVASSYDTSYSPWTGGSASTGTEGEATPHAVPTVDITQDDEPEIINPMGNMSFGAVPASTPDYNPPAAARKHVPVDDDDDEDLGFGNSSLSRNRTPKVPEADDKPAKEAAKPAESKPAKAEAKSSGGGWFGSFFKKKEEPGHNYTKANLGEESSMYFDKDLKRWVVKGSAATPEPSPTPPPPRATTASPAGIKPPSMSSTPPVSGMPAARSSLGPGGMGAPPPARSGPPSSGPPSAPPSGPPSGPPSAPASVAGARPGVPAASLDDLLSRPSSGRPSSGAATKKKRNKYVDIM